MDTVMTEPDDVYPRWLVAVTIFAWGGLVVALAAGITSGVVKRDMQQQAVEKGHAKWAVDDKGSVMFEWTQK